MYINKVVFLECKEVYKLLNKYKFLFLESDYGAIEIPSNFISDAKEDWEGYKETFDLPNDLTHEEFKEEVSNSIGADLYEKLETGEVDFCLICP